MKAYRLWIRKTSVSSSAAAEELVVNPSDFSCGQVLEIDHTNDETSRLILQVTAAKIEAKAGQIGLSQKVASAFQLKHHRDVNIRPVDPKDVMLELVELEMKDQYVCRSDMWRLKQTLQEKCVYVTKKLEFAGIRARVSGLWMAQHGVMSGYISSDTKIVFRSSSCVYYVFIQMSCEMWTFDPYGDLYFERAVGFLRELFDQWRVKECNHEVSLILFSRTFYGGALRDDFTPSDRESIQVDPSGRCYQDFYKVVSHSQTVSDFSPLLLDLKRCFSPYLTRVDCGRESGSVSRPNGRLSVASDGNILEAVNLALGTFERHHIDQQFDKVGHQILIITPGVGLFEVDRRLTYLTKQRALDSGFGIDLVCLSTQPLHAAPLFMFRRSHRGSHSGGNDFNIPYWINCSFHTSEAQATRNRQGKFISQISMRDFKETSDEKSNRPCAINLSLNVVEVPVSRVGRTSSFSEEDKLQRIDYDAYDAVVFNLHVRGQRRVSRLRSSNTEIANRNLDTLDLEGLSDDKYMSLLATSSPAQTVKQQIPRQGSLGVLAADARNAEQRTPTKHMVDDFDHSHQPRGSMVDRKSFGFEGVQALLPSGRAQWKYHGGHGSRPLVNPFAPSRVPLTFSFQRSRWSHTYRHDMEGQCIREHRVVKEEPPQMTTETIEEDNDSLSFDRNDCKMSEAVMAAAREAVSAQIRERSGLHPLQIDEGGEYGFLDSFSTVKDMAQDTDVDDSVLSFLTPPTTPLKKYQQSLPRLGRIRGSLCTPVAKWRLELIGMDWKSLLTPACLPLTTALAPSNLNKDYYENLYSLSADDSGSTSGIQLLTPDQIYHELISQRLCKGYQLVNGTSGDESQVQTVSRPLFPVPTQQQMYLSMGKSHHLIQLNSPQVEVTIFKPKHQQSAQPVRYHYKLCDLTGNGFQPSSATFHKDMNDDFNWNYLDHYVCGDSDFKELVDSLKYWRSRYLLLPVVMDMKADSLDANEVIQRRINGLMQFLEALHKLRRPSSSISKAHTRRLSIPDTPLQRHQHFLKQALTLAGNSLPVAKRQSRHRSLQPPGIYEDEQDQDFLKREAKDAAKPADCVEVRRLTEDSPLEEIFSAMKDPKFGVEVLNTASARINDCFLGCDVVTWLVNNVSGLDSREKAVTMAQKLVQSHCIVHCSGDSSHRVVDGFYLYRTVKREQKSDPVDASFSDTWMEMNVDRQQLTCPALGQASFRHPLMSTPTPTSSPIPSMLMSARSGSGSTGLSLKMMEIDHSPRKVVTVNVDPQGKSNRPEWCAVQYDSTYSPAHGFCIEFHWLVATPSLVNDMITSWARRASQNGLHLVPVPAYPMSQPYQSSGNPFRILRFLPLDLKSPSLIHYLTSGGLSPKQLLFSLQEAILARFNFLVDRPAGTKAQVSESTLAGAYRTVYVHESGSVFVQIANPNPSPDGSPGRGDSPLRSEHERPRLNLSLSKGKVSFEKPGFQWSPNHLISKRWRSPVAGDVEVADKLWQEMGSFCLNVENALNLFLVNVGFVESIENVE